ncbi:hypothetical protein F5H01DRAFT_138925 [Linnemannia elongata]|nr:hypothetical protein F5H01DRAFT_138925 [Linnemannia elongata]
MRPQPLFIPFVFLSYAAAVPLLMPDHQKINSMASSFSKSLRSWSNRGLNAFDDGIVCQEYVQATNDGYGNDSQCMSQNRGKMRQSPLDFKLGCLAQQRAKQGAEALMNMGSNAMDASSEYNTSLGNKDHGEQDGGYSGQQQGGYDGQQ